MTINRRLDAENDNYIEQREACTHVTRAAPFFVHEPNTTFEHRNNDILDQKSLKIAMHCNQYPSFGALRHIDLPVRQGSKSRSCCRQL